MLVGPTEEGRVGWFSARGLYLTKGPPSVKGSKRREWSAAGTLLGEEWRYPVHVPTKSPEVNQPQKATNKQSTKQVRNNF